MAKPKRPRDGDKTVLGALYAEINKMFSKYKDKIATDCASRKFGQKNKCKAEYRVMAYTKAIPIIKRRISTCKKDIWNGEDKCRKKMTKVLKIYQTKIDQHRRSYKQFSAITPSRRAKMDSVNMTIDPITQHILEKDNSND